MDTSSIIRQGIEVCFHFLQPLPQPLLKPQPQKYYFQHFPPVNCSVTLSLFKISNIKKILLPQSWYFSIRSWKIFFSQIAPNFFFTNLKKIFIIKNIKHIRYFEPRETLNIFHFSTYIIHRKHKFWKILPKTFQKFSKF